MSYQNASWFQLVNENYTTSKHIFVR